MQESDVDEESEMAEVSDGFNDDFGKMDVGPLRLSRVLDIGDGNTAWIIDGALNMNDAQNFIALHSAFINPRKYTYMHIVSNSVLHHAFFMCGLRDCFLCRIVIICCVVELWNNYSD